MRRVSLLLAVLSALLGALCAWGEADPLAAVIEARSATLVCGIAALLFALPLRGRLRVALAAAGIALMAIAASWYLRS